MTDVNNQIENKNKSKFYSAKNPINFQANKNSFVFKGKVQFESIRDKNDKSIDHNQNKLKASVLYSNQSKNLKLG